MSSVVSIAIKPDGVEQRPVDRFARIAVESARLVEGRGIDGDRKANGADRQLNVMCRETLEQMKSEGYRVGPGEMGEQIVLDGIVIEQTTPGTRIQLGETAIIEVVTNRTGCSRLENIQKMPVKQSSSRIGVMARVVRGGVIRVGDPIRVLQ